MEYWVNAFISQYKLTTMEPTSDRHEQQFKTKFIPRDIYMSIDFSKGTPSFYEHISYTKNAIRNYSRIEPNTYAFDFILDRDYNQLIGKINSETGFKEIIDVTTMFDGAAPIGGMPYVFEDEDEDDDEDDDVHCCRRE